MTEFKGLTEKQAEDRRKKGEVNKTRRRYTKTVGRIIFDNLFTYFNILTVSLFILVLLTGSFKNALFIGVVFSNAFTGILQEIKAKRLVDKLAIITAERVTAVRDGRKVQIRTEEIVKDDILIVEAGNQISVDAVVEVSERLELDESLLTGEGIPVRKEKGDLLLSGSFVSAGSGIIRATGVGEESYASKLTGETKKRKKAHSEIIGTISKIIRYMSYVILPAGGLLFATQYMNGTPANEAVIGMVGAVIGMIPSGLVLISTVAMTLGVLRCAKHNALVQDAAAIEVLARIDTLCIDKTGTLTDGSMHLREIVPLEGTVAEAKNLFSECFSAFEENNFTSKAILAALGKSTAFEVTDKMPFSSERKWSGVSFKEYGTYIIGAPEFVFGSTGLCKKYLEDGYRVIALAQSRERLSEELPEKIIPVAMAILEDGIRADAADVVKIFRESGVQIKIISGDNPVTVSNIAKKIGLDGAEKYIDMSQCDKADIASVTEEYEIFGRVTPQQKKQIVAELKKKGKTVAMTGDGVNDVPALQEADCSVAMAGGSDAAKGVAKIVLVNSDFAPLTDVVGEGRRIINNLEAVSSMYITKTLYSLFLTLFFIISGGQYPLQPVHLTLIGALSTGIPSFLLAMEKNTRRIKPGFVQRMGRNALPGSLVITVAIIGLYTAYNFGLLQEPSYILQSVWITGFISLTVLLGVSRPLNFFRGTIAAVMMLLFVGAMLLFGGVMGLVVPTIPDILMMAVISIAGVVITLRTMVICRDNN